MFLEKAQIDIKNEKLKERIKYAENPMEEAENIFIEQTETHYTQKVDVQEEIKQVQEKYGNKVVGKSKVESSKQEFTECLKKLDNVSNKIKESVSEQNEIGNKTNDNDIKLKELENKPETEEIKS